MDIQGLHSTILPLLALPIAVLGIPKLWHEVRKLREEDRHALAAKAHDIAVRHPNIPALERFALQEAIAALVPDPDLTHVQRITLLAQPDAREAALLRRKYSDWLTVDSKDIAWKSQSLNTRFGRLWRVGLATGLYVLLSLATVAPLWWWQQQNPGQRVPNEVLLATVATCLLLFPFSIWALRAGMRLLAVSSALEKRNKALVAMPRNSVAVRL